MNKKKISVVMATAMAASMVAAVPMTASADDTVELTFMGWEASTRRRPSRRNQKGRCPYRSVPVRIAETAAQIQSPPAALRPWPGSQKQWRHSP